MNAKRQRARSPLHDGMLPPNPRRAENAYLQFITPHHITQRRDTNAAVSLLPELIRNARVTGGESRNVESILHYLDANLSPAARALVQIDIVRPPKAPDRPTLVLYPSRQ